MNSINDRSINIGEYIPAPDDDMLICRCEEITKGEIRRAVHDGMFTLTEIRRYLRTGMGLCQGQTCSKLVKALWPENCRYLLTNSNLPPHGRRCGQSKCVSWQMKERRKPE